MKKPLRASGWEGWEARRSCLDVSYWRSEQAISRELGLGTALDGWVGLAKGTPRDRDLGLGLGGLVPRGQGEDPLPPE